MVVFPAEHSESPILDAVPEPRKVALDCLRGLMLTIVLADHLDFAAASGGTIRNWTLIGLGFSDAADVFVFLSGFVFGLAYGKRIRRDGRWLSLKHGLFRTLQIYMGFMVCVVCVGLLRVGSGTLWSDQCSEWLANTWLANQPPNTGILCLYIVLLPWLLLLFVAVRERLWWVMLGISLAVYVMAQIAVSAGWQLAGWNFQPLAWQFLMVFAAIQGRKFSASGATGWPRSKIFFVASVLVLLLGLAAKKGEWLPLSFDWIRNSPLLQSQQWTGKSNWAPLRGLHHLSLVYATVSLIPLSSRFWMNRMLEPLRACGRHSLTIYCLGVILAQAASILFRWMGNGPAVVCLIVVDAIVVQFFCAWILDRYSVSASGVGPDSLVRYRYGKGHF
jgi:hypothetical protein